MAEITVTHVDEMSAYEGPHAVESIKFCSAGKQLGVSAWGMNVLKLAPGCTDYPSHDHVKDGQEEVYVVLSGSVVLSAGEASWSLTQGSFARVGPAETRVMVAGDAGAVVLALGGVPGPDFPTM